MSRKSLTKLYLLSFLLLPQTWKRKIIETCVWCKLCKLFTRSPTLRSQLAVVVRSNNHYDNLSVKKGTNSVSYNFEMGLCLLLGFRRRFSAPFSLDFFFSTDLVSIRVLLDHQNQRNCLLYCKTFLGKTIKILDIKLSSSSEIHQDIL